MNGECVAWVRADQYSIPGGSLPVTETAYTPGLKLPVVNKEKDTRFLGTSPLQVNEQPHDEAEGANDVKVMII